MCQKMVRLDGLEPSTFSLSEKRSNQLSYKRILGNWKSVKIKCKLFYFCKNNSTDYDAYNNAYGNFADTYLNECLPNIKGKPPRTPFFSSPEGAFSVSSAGANVSDCGGCYGIVNVEFSAARSSSIYRDNCNAVRVKSYGVYIWQRTS